MITITLTEEESNVLTHAMRFIAVNFSGDFEGCGDELISILQKNERAQTEPQIRELNRKAGLEFGPQEKTI